jgi:hypothetical protein
MRRCVTIRDGAGKAIGIACTSRPRLRCATAGCTGEGSVLCDYPITRRNRAGTCSRRVCGKCAKHVGPKLDYCPPHARLHDEGAAERRVMEEVFPGAYAQFFPAAKAKDFK